MDFLFSTEQAAFRDEAREFLRHEVTDALRAETRQLNRPGPETAAFKKKLVQRKWLGVAWPTAYGGLGRSHMEQYLLAEELEYAEAPPLPLVVTSIGPTLARVGTEQQKTEFLPGILRGSIDLALGYSETNAGTDLAAMETGAVQQGDGYVIHGQKMFTSIAHLSTHIWLAARTDPDVPRHKGISIFLVPVDAPGLTIRPIWLFGEGRTNEVFFDNVRVEGTALVGEKNKGWYYMMMALDFERGSLAPYSMLLKLLEDLVDYVKAHRMDRPPVDAGRVRHMLADMATRIAVARALAYRTAWMIDRGQAPRHEAHVQKVHRSETLHALTQAAVNTLGLYGLLDEGDRHAVSDGKYPRHLILSLRTMIGAGTNEVLRTSIATRGLGLPR